MSKSYSELLTLPTYEERFEYCRTNQHVGEETFGSRRYLNQRFYTSKEWKTMIRPKIILRDNGCDLAMDGYPISGPIFIHHLNPIRLEDLIERSDWLLIPEFLVCTSLDTHNALHYGAEAPKREYKPRRPNDTAPWLMEVAQ